MPEIKPKSAITTEERAAMERVAMAYTALVNAERANLSNGLLVHAIVLGCAASLSSLCPITISRQNYIAFVELAADNLIETMLPMLGK